MRQAILLFVFLVVTIFSVDLFLKEPAVWPDEAVLADIASNIVHENRVGTDLWQGLIPGIENHDLSYPPVFYLTDALWIKIFGLSIVNLRLLSVIFSLGF